MATALGLFVSFLEMELFSRLRMVWALLDLLLGQGEEFVYIQKFIFAYKKIYRSIYENISTFKS